jgi:tRNA (guanine37-N1)-methyltransferase
MIEAISRLVPGVVGNPDSLVEESHELGDNGTRLLEYPSYTRPQNFRGLEVPSILLSGNHQQINNWRKEQSMLRTATRTAAHASTQATATRTSPTPT